MPGTKPKSFSPRKPTLSDAKKLEGMLGKKPVNPAYLKHIGLSGAKPDMRDVIKLERMMGPNPPQYPFATKAPPGPAPTAKPVSAAAKARIKKLSTLPGKGKRAAMGPKASERTPYTLPPRSKPNYPKAGHPKNPKTGEPAKRPSGREAASRRRG